MLFFSISGIIFNSPGDQYMVNYYFIIVPILIGIFFSWITLAVIVQLSYCYLCFLIKEPCRNKDCLLLSKFLCFIFKIRRIRENSCCGDNDKFIQCLFLFYIILAFPFLPFFIIHYCWKAKFNKYF